MKRYAVVIEKGKRNYSAYSPDVPGCTATGKTLKEVRRRFQGALQVHLQGTAEDGDPIPEPTSIVEYVEVEEPQPAATKNSSPRPSQPRNETESLTRARRAGK